MKNFRAISIILISLMAVGILATYMLAQETRFGNMLRQHNERLSVFSDLSRSLCGEEKKAGGERSFINCGRVSASVHSRMLSLPQTSWGMMYFLFMALAALPLFFIGDRPRRGYLVFLFWLLALGSVYSLYMFLVSLIKVHALCPLCLITYLANWGGLGIVAASILKNKINPLSPGLAFRDIREPLSLKAQAALIGALALALGLSAGAGLNLEKYLTSVRERHFEEKRDMIIGKIVEEFTAQAPFELRPVPLCIVGNPSAPLTIVEFSDFLCGHCAKASELVKAAAAEFGDRVRIIFVNLPLEKSCNKEITSDMHKGACLLARGALCAARQGRFPDYLDNAFALRTNDPGEEVMRRLAVVSGLDIGDFEVCLSSKRTREELAAQLAEAHRLKISSTPTIFINGKRLSIWRDPKLISRAIERELKAIK